MKTFRSLLPRGLALATLLYAGSTDALAQAPVALPTAPGAHRAVDGGLTGAAASLPNGASPLEPYLVTWLLPVAGILTFAFMTVVDKRTRRV